LNHNSFLFIFLDGVGLGEINTSNPFWVYSLPGLEQIAGGKWVKGIERKSENVLFKGIDACLNMPGKPQSATGQTALFTGKNSARMVGRHVPAFPDDELGAIIKEHSIFKSVCKKNKKAIFANAYRASYLEQLHAGKRVPSVTTLAVRAAQIPYRTFNDLWDEKAVYFDITGDYARSSLHEHVPLFSPEKAADILISLTTSSHLVVFESFMTDILGHKMNVDTAAAFLAIIDRCLARIVQKLPDYLTVIISSDHGNIEDLSHAYHTRNSVPLVVIGNKTIHFEGIHSICDVAPVILSLL